MSYMPILNEASRSSQSSTDSDGFSQYMSEEEIADFAEKVEKHYTPKDVSTKELTVKGKEDLYHLMQFIYRYRWTHATRRIFTYLSRMDTLPDMRSVAKCLDTERIHRKKNGDLLSNTKICKLSLLLKPHKTYVERWHAFKFYHVHGIRPEIAMQLTLATDVYIRNGKETLVSHGYDESAKKWAHGTVADIYSNKANFSEEEREICTYTGQLIAFPRLHPELKHVTIREGGVVNIDSIFT